MASGDRKVRHARPRKARLLRWTRRVWKRLNMQRPDLVQLQFDQRVVLWVRAAVLFMGTVLTLVQRRDPAAVTAVVLLIVLAAAVSLPAVTGLTLAQRWLPLGEALLACGAMLIVEPLPK